MARFAWSHRSDYGCSMRDNLDELGMDTKVTHPRPPPAPLLTLGLPAGDQADWESSSHCLFR